MEQQYCLSTTIFHSHCLTQIGYIKLYIDNQQKHALLLAKNSSIEFCVIENNKIVETFEINLNCNIVKLKIIPTKYKRSDLIFVLDSKSKFSLIRINNQKDIDQVASDTHTGEKNRIYKTQEFHCCVDYNFNVNDTEGYIIYAKRQSIMIINFVEKLEGFKVLNYSTHNFGYIISYIGTINKKLSKYKQNSTIGIVYQQDQKSHFRIYDTNFLQLDYLNVDKTNIINFYAGTELIILTPREVFMYTYSNKPIVSYKIPVTNSIHQVIYLEEVYCMLGEQLIIFNERSLKNYGEFYASSGVHIGGNKILVRHEDEDAKLVEIEEECIKQIHKWINLGNIFSVETIRDSGEQLFVVVSPNKKHQITIFNKSQSIRCLLMEELQQPINRIHKIEINDEIYIFISYFDESLSILKLVAEGIEQINTMESKLLLAHPKYLILQTGIYEAHYEPQMTLSLKQELNKHSQTQKIVKAWIQSQILVYETNNLLLYIIDLATSSYKHIVLNSPLSILYIHGGIIYYSQWDSKLLVLFHQRIQSIKVQNPIADIVCFQNFIFLGFSKGKVQIYENVNQTLIKKNTFHAGTLSVKFQLIDNKVYCLSNKTSVISYQKGIFEKKGLAIRNLCGILSLPNNKFIAASNLQFSIIEISRQQNIISTEIAVSTEQIPYVKIFKKQIYVFTPKLLEIYDPYYQQKRIIKHEIESIECVDKNQEGVLVGGIVQKNNMLIYFKGFEQYLRYPLKRKPRLIKYIGQMKFGLVMQNQFKIVLIKENKIIELLSNQLSITPYSFDIYPKFDKMIALDPIKSMILYHYNTKNNKVVPLSRFVSDRLSNQVSFLHDYIIQTDKSGNLFITQPNLNASSDLEKINLQLKGGKNFGEEIWTISRQDGVLIYGTGSGSVGKIFCIKKRQFQILRETEELLIKTTGYSGFKYQDWTQLRMSNMPRIDMSNNCLIDGDILKTMKRKLSDQNLIRILGKSKTKIQYEQIMSILQSVQRINY